MGFEFFGVRELRESLTRLKEGHGDAIDTALEDSMTEVVYPETQVLIPKLTGLMAGTGRVERTEGEEHAFSIWYGDSAVNDKTPGVVDYAAAVHERDATHEPPTQYKYVETVLEESKEIIAQRVADKLEELME